MTCMQSFAEVQESKVMSHRGKCGTSAGGGGASVPVGGASVLVGGASVPVGGATRGKVKRMRSLEER